LHNFIQDHDIISIDTNGKPLEIEFISHEKKKQCEEKKLLIQSCSDSKPTVDLNTIMMKVHDFSIRKLALESLLNNGYLHETVSIKHI
jgi:hypothetical protein